MANYIVIASAIAMALFMSFAVIYLSKIREYMEDRGKTDKSVRFKIADGSWRILWATISIYTAFIMPFDVIRHFFIGDVALMKRLQNIYFISFMISLIALIIILVKIGKIKIRKK